MKGFVVRGAFCGVSLLAIGAVLLFAAALPGGAAAGAQTLAHKGWAGSGITVEPWWAGAVLYQIDPVSFQDSKGDGFGDLRGVAQRLDYLQSLGVDAIVLSPFQLRAEFGQRGSGPPFDPKYGQEEDLDHLLQEAGRRKIRVFVDLPLAAAGPTAELVNGARFWLSRGIAGLRLTHDSHDPALPAAQIAERMKALRRLCATYAGQRVLLWDMPEPPAGGTDPAPSRGRRHASPPALPDGPQMLIDGRLAAMPRLDAAGLREALGVDARHPPAAEPTPVPVSDRAGRPRSFDRDGSHNLELAKELAKVLAAALLTSRGAPMLYFAQEIGMATTPAASAHPVDPTPMQWGGDADFTGGVPSAAPSTVPSIAVGGIDMGRNALTASVALEDADPASLLNWYRRLSALHHQNAALRVGTMDLIAESNPDIVAWVRRPRESGSLTAPVVVVCNLTGRSLLVSVAADLRRAGIQTSSPIMHTLASTALTSDVKEPVVGPVLMNAIALPPYGVYIGELARQPGLETAPSPLRHSSR